MLAANKSKQNKKTHKLISKLPEFRGWGRRGKLDNEKKKMQITLQNISIVLFSFNVSTHALLVH